MAVPTIDGTGVNNTTGGTSSSVVLTTSLANDVIVICVFQEKSGVGLISVTGITGGGLTFAKRASQASGEGENNLEIWWAVAPTALAAVTFTIAFNGTFDDCSVVAFGANGCYTAAPWSANASLPAGVFGNTLAATISTSEVNDLIIAVFGDTANNATKSNYPAGFTGIANTQNGGGALFSEIGAASLAAAAIQTGLTVTWGSGATGFSIMLVDALTASGAPIPYPVQQGPRQPPIWTWTP